MDDGPVLDAVLRLVALGDTTIRHGADILREAGDGYGLTAAEEDAFKVEMALRALADAIVRERRGQA